MDLIVTSGEGWRRINGENDQSERGVVGVPSAEYGIFLARWSSGDQETATEIGFQDATADQVDRVERGDPTVYNELAQGPSVTGEIIFLGATMVNGWNHDVVSVHEYGPFVGQPGSSHAAGLSLTVEAVGVDGQPGAHLT